MRENARHDYDTMMSAIAILDILGLYMKKGYIDERLALDEWGWLYARAHSKHGEHVLKEREENDEGGRVPWPHFRELGEKATARHLPPTGMPGN